MTIVKNSMLTKTAVGIVAFAAGIFMLGGAAIAPAYAQSNEDLQAQIQSLLETIASLQAQVDGGTSAGVSGTCPSSIFSASVGQGAQGQAVQDLQVFLNMDADTRVAASGAGSPGNETMYFGALTAQAVSSFQSKYSANILAPLGLSAPTGFWGSSSASYAQTLCASMAEDHDDADDSDESVDDSDETVSTDWQDGQEAQFANFNVTNEFSGEQLREGDRNAEVMNFEFDVEDGNMKVSRADIKFQVTDSTAEQRPWRLLDGVSIWHNGEQVASVDADRRSDWNDRGGDEYEIRLSGLDTVVWAGESADFTVAVDVRSSINDANFDGDDEINFNVWVDDAGIRGLDGAGIHQTTGDDSDFTDFVIENIEGDLEITSSSNNPDASVLQVNESTRSDEYGVFVFNMEADKADMIVESLTFNATTSATSSLKDVVRRATLSVNNTDYRGEIVNGATTATNATGTIEFDYDEIDRSIEIDADETVEFTLYLEFYRMDGNYENNDWIEVGIDGEDGVTAENTEENPITVKGDQKSEQHSLLVSGITTSLNSTSVAVRQIEGTTAERGEYTIKFDVTAFEEDAYIANAATSTAGATSTVYGLVYGLLGNDFNGSEAANVTFQSSQTTEVGDHYKIDAGDTAEVTLRVVLNNSGAGTAGFFGVALDEVRFGDEVGGTYIPVNSGLDDYETDVEYLNE